LISFFDEIIVTQKNFTFNIGIIIEFKNTKNHNIFLYQKNLVLYDKYEREVHLWMI